METFMWFDIWLPNLIENLENKILEVKLKYWDDRTIIIINNEQRKKFMDLIDSFPKVITKNNHYRRWTTNIMDSFWWIPVEFTDNFVEILPKRIMEYWKILYLWNNEYFELYDRETLLRPFNPNILWNL